jgi:hypothetical protein
LAAVPALFLFASTAVAQRAPTAAQSFDTPLNSVASDFTSSGTLFGVRSEITNVQSLNFISEGSSENLSIQAISHITINAAGQVTAVTEQFSITCRG